MTVFVSAGGSRGGDLLDRVLDVAADLLRRLLEWIREHIVILVTLLVVGVLLLW